MLNKRKECDSIMVNAKEQILEIINTLPNDASWDDIIYALYFHSKLKKSRKDLENGNYLTLKDFDQQMEAKYENCNIKRSEKGH